MAGELTPRERRELEAIDRALSGRAVDADLEDIAALTRELRDGREAPRREFAEGLDERAAAWLAGSRPRRRGLSWLRVGVPAAAAAAAAVVVAVAVIGGDGSDDGSRLALTAVPEEQRESALAAPERAPKGADGDDHGERIVGKELELERRRVQSGEPLAVRYEVFAKARAMVDFAGRSGEITLEPGSGRLEIATEGVEAGRQPLSIVLQPGGSLHMTVAVEG